ncbi:hypothetical protein [Clostridium magnum]|uniref:Uncharacterized protein n=1 Tax=Clostridium magnum DSM 2767 TaxID=1121326 RepID=A0A162QPL8_9CLOT|nr:hypothetical protein [Clostridium magnum]KZL88794.1 hypothetical protein CLMAG_58870 [Clostridium magnum DSM 2767]SHI78486.1 hypothetical protein SAMN02745944_04849 [Clostridium magnum DSM 2767]
MLLSEQLKEKLRNEFMPIKSLKIFSNGDTLNLKIAFLKTLPKGIRGTCSMILDFFECRVNTKEAKDNYMIVYASQQEIADTLGFTREYISHCINRMSETPNCIFTKVRQGLNKANYYIMEKKKELVNLLKQIYKAQQKEAQVKNQEKQQRQKKEYNKQKVSMFNSFKQREYSKEDLKNIEYALLGWT